MLAWKKEADSCWYEASEDAVKPAASAVGAFDFWGISLLTSPLMHKTRLKWLFS